MNQDHSILWRRLDMPGHESVLVYSDEGWYLDGAAIFLHDGKACRLEYLIKCDPEWKTGSASIDGWINDVPLNIEIDVIQGNRWHVNGEEIQAVTGAVDLDLNFSPITNTLPLRRLGLNIAESAEVRAAWLRFPSFELEPLEQTYTRLDESTYRFKVPEAALFVK
ncbi:MAG: putative glycolipid-binding domain-containing protein [Pyrinomonadaceae bacterium]